MKLAAMVVKKLNVRLSSMNICDFVFSLTAAAKRKQSV
jgi:hypothetical protein